MLLRGGVFEAMQKATQMTEAEVERQRNAVSAFVLQNHSAQSYKNAFSAAINNILNRVENSTDGKILDLQIGKSKELYGEHLGID